MNIQQVSSILQGLTDQQLQMEMKSPSPGVPQFMVLSEMQRRQKMRAEAAPPAPPATTSVAEDTMSKGVASTPQMASGMDAPGGVASFAGGGSVERSRGFPNSNYPSGGPGDLGEYDWSPEALDYFRRVREQVANSFSMPDNNETFADYLSRGAKNAKVPSALKKALGGIDAEVGRSQASIPDLTQFQFSKPALPAAAAAAPAAPSITSSLPPVSLPPELEAAAQDAPPMRSGVMAAARAKGVAVPAPAVDAPSREMPPLVPPDRIPNPKIESPEDYIDKVSAANPDSTGELLDRYGQRLSENKGRGKDALNMALIQAGLGMMSAGAKSGNFLGAVGEGGISGLNSYTKNMQDIRERADKIEQMRDAATMARDAAKRGNYKLAAEIANQANTRNVALHGQDVTERRADMTMAQADRHFSTQMDKVDKQIASAERIAAGHNAATLQAASMRGVGSLGGMDAKTLKTALSQFNANRSKLAQANPYNPLTANGMTMQQWMQSINDAAMEGFTPEYRAAVNSVMGGSPATKAQPYAAEITSKGLVRH